MPLECIANKPEVIPEDLEIGTKVRVITEVKSALYSFI